MAESGTEIPAARTKGDGPSDAVTSSTSRQMMAAKDA